MRSVIHGNDKNRRLRFMHLTFLLMVKSGSKIFILDGADKFQASIFSPMVVFRFLLHMHYIFCHIALSDQNCTPLMSSSSSYINFSTRVLNLQAPFFVVFIGTVKYSLYLTKMWSNLTRI